MLREIETEMLATRLTRDQVHMSKHGSFWLTSSARGNTEHEHVVWSWLLSLVVAYDTSTFRDQIVEMIKIKAGLGSEDNMRFFGLIKHNDVFDVLQKFFLLEVQ